MKERFVLDLKGNKARREIVKIQEYTRNGNFDCIVFKNVNQVPETWEELKELVREKVYDDDRNGIKIGQCVKVEYILIDGKSFMPDGEILDEDNDVFAVNRTPAQMWQIIKNLIGEE